MKKRVACWITAAFVCLGLGCRNYKVNRIEDVTLIGNDVYMLIRCETGRDYTSRFSHSAAFEPRHATFIIASCDITKNELELVFHEKLEVDTKEFLAATVLYLVSTNTIVAGTGPNLFEVVRIPGANGFEAIHATRISFNASRSAIIACGEHPRVYSSATLHELAERDAVGLLREHCLNLEGRMVRNSVISDDLSEVVNQDFTGQAAQPALEIWGKNGLQTKIELTHGNQILHGISTDGNFARLFVSESDGKEQKVAFINLEGHVLTETEMQNGQLIFDGRFDPIVSMPVEQMLYPEENDLRIEVWSPSKNEKRWIRLDSKKWLRLLNH